MPKIEINRERLLQRFLKYVRVETTANPDIDQYPSTPGQRELGAILAAELTEMGAADVLQDEHAVVYGTVPATSDQSCPVVAFNSHVDTSPDASGKNVQPQVIDNYQGGDIPLKGSDRTIVASENPELATVMGHTVITTDGTTLLGADDKAGVAIIMEAAQTMLENPGLTHGDVRVLFTCDEEIGRGVNHVDLKRLAADVCYTLDGGGADSIDVETFSADGAVVTFQGVNIHPAIAKDRMINAIRALGMFVDSMPRAASPERTSDREGFLHPHRIEGGVDEVKLHIILRDFDTPKLAEYGATLRTIASSVMADFPGLNIDVAIKEQYRNLGDGLKLEPRAAGLARVAHERLGRTPVENIIRGGTDGSRLTELGLPTPNLSSGQHNLHSPLEWASLDEMVAAVEVVLELAQVWAEQS